MTDKNSETNKLTIGNRQSAIAYVFPGQGSQAPGMGKDLAQKFAAARQIFEAVDAALAFALSDLCFNGPAEDLQLTENTQPAILATSIATLRVMEAENFPKPDYVAGHSLGEYSALVAAASLSLNDAVKTVRARGRYMQEAVPVGTGAMAAILGAGPVAALSALILILLAGSLGQGLLMEWLGSLYEPDATGSWAGGRSARRP